MEQRINFLNFRLAAPHQEHHPRIHQPPIQFKDLLKSVDIGHVVKRVRPAQRVKPLQLVLLDLQQE